MPDSVREPIVGRFAPSPTGRMHAGNIYAALMAWLVAKSQGGTMVLRIEDLDRDRAKPAYADQIMRDFEQLGLTWDRGPYYQRNRDAAYSEAFGMLLERGLVYPCFCTRADLHAASAPHRGEKIVYPGTCRNLSAEEREARSRERTPSWRLRVPSGEEGRYRFTDSLQGPYEQVLDRDCGDFAIRRSDGLFAYQLAVVLDDAEQGVTSVVRGVDLLSSTPQQLYLQDALDLPHPAYAHIPLLVAERDRRLSKRDRDASLDEMLARFGTPQRILGHIAWVVGLAPEDGEATPEELLACFSLSSFREHMRDSIQIAWK